MKKLQTNEEGNRTHKLFRSIRDGAACRRYSPSSFAWTTLRRSQVFHLSCQVVKTTSCRKRQEDTMQPRKPRAFRCSGFVNCVFQLQCGKYGFNTLMEGSLCGIIYSRASNVKIFSGITAQRTHRSEINGTAERAVRGVQKGTSAVLLQSGLVTK